MAVNKGEEQPLFEALMESWNREDTLKHDLDITSNLYWDLFSRYNILMSAIEHMQFQMEHPGARFEITRVE